MPDQFAAINGVLRNYYDGLYHCDVALLKTVFHENAHYHTTSPGEHLHYDMETYFGVIAERMPPAAGEAYGYEVETIRFAGNDTAFAILKCEMMGKRFTDFLSFIRENNEWRIVAKVFHYDLIEGEA
ncbi:nuclear transport factor 2 family protein [Hyphococcus flavus]|uniref:Nuclear transport factor 2 family protein n=1 Tax=Hyphococcus flavus TaxID=1866326 RepID=A0AAF0CGI3_9PROT|nr:nuclear transport factor 2 family protein [Hyphococcus flavus]WDI32218.1 nuclear transport factor 2 family protein [Hyphococcus flavus]